MIATLLRSAPGQVNLLKLFALWHRNARSRTHLARLAPHHLADIGLTPNEAQREARQPFWR